MAALPKVDSAGLRQAKIEGSERVSSVTTVTKQDVGSPRERGAGRELPVNGHPPIPAANRRPPSGNG